MDQTRITLKFNSNPGDLYDINHCIIALSDNAKIILGLLKVKLKVDHAWSLYQFLSEGIKKIVTCFCHVMSQKIDVHCTGLFVSKKDTKQCSDVTKVWFYFFFWSMTFHDISFSRHSTVHIFIFSGSPFHLLIVLFRDDTWFCMRALSEAITAALASSVGCASSSFSIL